MPSGMFHTGLATSWKMGACSCGVGLSPSPLITLRWLLIGNITSGTQDRDDGRDARVARAGLDRLTVGNGLLTVLARLLGVADEGGTERLIFVALRRQRVQPVADIPFLQRLLQPSPDI